MELSPDFIAQPVSGGQTEFGTPAFDCWGDVNFEVYHSLCRSLSLTEHGRQECGFVNLRVETAFKRFAQWLTDRTGYKPETAVVAVPARWLVDPKGELEVLKAMLAELNIAVETSVSRANAAAVALSYQQYLQYDQEWSGHMIVVDVSGTDVEASVVKTDGSYAETLAAFAAGNPSYRGYDMVAEKAVRTMFMRQQGDVLSRRDRLFYQLARRLSKESEPSYQALRQYSQSCFDHIVLNDNEFAMMTSDVILAYSQTMESYVAQVMDKAISYILETGIDYHDNNIFKLLVIGQSSALALAEAQVEQIWQQPGFLEVAGSPSAWQVALQGVDLIASGKVDFSPRNPCAVAVRIMSDADGSLDWQDWPVLEENVRISHYRQGKYLPSWVRIRMPQNSVNSKMTLVAGRGEAGELKTCQVGRDLHQLLPNAGDTANRWRIGLALNEFKVLSFAAIDRYGQHQITQLGTLDELFIQHDL